MTKEQEKAIEYLEDSLKATVTHKEKLEVIKNLIQTQQEEIETLKYIKRNFDYVVQKETEKKDKIIDELVDELTCDEFDNCCSECTHECERDYDQLSVCIKQYFERKIKNE